MDVWPSRLLMPLEERWTLRGVAMNGGMSVSGVSNFSRTDGGGLWVCEQSFLFGTIAQIKTARALDAILDGGATSIIMPAFERIFAPYPGIETEAFVPFSDYASFSDDTLFESGLINVTLAADAALRATTLVIEPTAAAALTGGERFSIVHPVRGERLYTVARVSPLEDGEQTITIRPPLREAATAGAELDFDKPGCVVRLANPGDFLGALNGNHHVEARAQWVEAF